MTTKSARKILVIDADSLIVDLLIERLQGEVSVSFASEASKAMELAKLHKPDLILVDVTGFGQAGFDVCKSLKADPETQHVPVVFLTGEDDGESVARGLELGAINTISKPFDPEMVSAKVRSILNQITAIRAAAKTTQKNPSAAGPTGDRRAEGARRPDRYAGAGNDKGGTNDRRAQGAARADRFEKPAWAFRGFSLAHFAFVAVLAAAAWGGYAYINKGGDLEQSLQAEINETKESPLSNSYSSPATKSAPAPVSSARSCDELPDVPWWGNTTHASIIAYVDNKNEGDWDVYISKWQDQLEKLQSIHDKDGTVIAPRLGTRLAGPELAEYVEQVETRVEIARCLAASVAGR